MKKHAEMKQLKFKVRKGQDYNKLKMMQIMYSITDDNLKFIDDYEIKFSIEKLKR